MLSKSSYLGLAALIATHVVSSPLSARIADFDSMIKRNDSSDPCPLVDQTPEAMAAAWSSVGADVYLDDFLNGHPDLDPEGWYRLMYEQIYGSNNPNDCDVVGQECDVDDDCTNFTTQHPDDAPAYWVFYAVQRVHEWMNAMNKGIVDSLNQLDVESGQIESDFGPPPEGDFGILNMISSLLVLASAAAGEAAPILTMAVGVAGIVANSAEDQPDVSLAIDQQILNMWTSLSTQINTTNAEALQGLGGDIATLPMQTGDFTNPISKFFDEGKWLVDSVSDLVEPQLAQMHSLLRQGIVMNVLKDQSYFVYCDEEGTADDCAGDNEAWVEGQGCAQLWTWTDGCPSCNSGSPVLYGSPASSDIMDKMKEPPYSFDLTSMFSNAIGCGINNPSGGTTDWSTVGDDGLPPCFFNWDVIRGTHTNNGFSPDNVNTVLDQYCSDEEGGCPCS